MLASPDLGIPRQSESFADSEYGRGQSASEYRAWNPAPRYTIRQVPAQPSLAPSVQHARPPTVADARQSGAEAPVEALVLMLIANGLLHLLPLHTEWWIGEHVVKLPVRVPVLRERIPARNVGDVLPFDEHVGLADGVGLVVQLLPVHGEPGLGVVLGQVFACHGEHAAGAGCGVINGAHHASLRQHVVILDEDQVDHQPDAYNIVQDYNVSAVYDPTGPIVCQDNYEVGDILAGIDMPPVKGENGYTYTVQEIAFFSYFYGGPSFGVNGWYSSNNTLTSDAGPACNLMSSSATTENPAHD